MGRRNDKIDPDAPYVFHIQRIKMVDGDYDAGGAYWGGGGQPLYCAWAPAGEDTDECRVFLRANTLDDAKADILSQCPAATFVEGAPQKRRSRKP